MCDWGGGPNQMYNYLPRVEAAPVKMEKELKKEASKKGLTGDRKNAYVYGTLRKTGWKPEREK